MICIEHIALPVGDMAAIDETFSLVEDHPIACNNWARDYPYAPDVSFRMFHNGTTLFLRYGVAEHCTMARVARDNGEVWTDSCVEFFIAPDRRGYYNFEANCTGRLLLAFRRERSTPRLASSEVTASVKRSSSLGDAPFDERVGDNRWTLTLAIPSSALFMHGLKSWSGLNARMNLYKCGDNLSQPHFLSWKPIRATRPDFHLPEFFEEVVFNK